MIGIELRVKEVHRVVRQKGNPVDSSTLTQALAILTDHGYIIEVLSGEASVVIRDLYKRFVGRQLHLEDATDIVEAL